MFSSLFSIFTEPTGALLFFLVMFVLGQAALFIAYGQRRRGAQERTAGRYTVAAGGVIACWLVLLVGVVAASLLRAPQGAIQPILEPATAAALFVIVGWGFATADSPVDEARYTRAAGALLGVIAVAAIVTLAQWLPAAATPDAVFSSTRYALTWALLPLAAAAAGAAMLILRAPMVNDLPLKVLFFVAGGLGYVLAGFGSLRGAAEGMGGAPRLLLLIAMPIWPAVIYRFVIGRLAAIVANAEARARLDGTPSLSVPGPAPLTAAAETTDAGDSRESVAVLKALGDMIERESPADIPMQIVKAAANAVKADVAALLALDDPEYADVIAAWDGVQQRPIAALAIKIAEQPSLVGAINSRDQRALRPDRNLNELVDLYSRMDIQRAGPAYYQALVKDGEVVGALVIALPYTSRDLRESEQTLLTALAPIAARLYTISRSAQREQREAPDRAVQDALSSDVANSAAAIRADIQATLEQSRTQITELNNRVRDLQIELDYERSRLAELAGGAEDGDGQSITQRIQLLSEERARLAEERQRLAQAVQEAQTRILGATAEDDDDAYGAMIEVLRRERDDLQAQKASLENELDEIRRRGGSVPPPAVLRKVLTNLSEEKARLQADRDSLAGQLRDVGDQLKALGIEGPTGLAQMLAQLTEERAHYKIVAERALQDREVLIEERKRLSDQITRETEREAKMNALEGAVRRLAADREALMQQRDQLRQSVTAQQSEIEQWQEERAQFIAEAEALQEDLSAAVFERNQLQKDLAQVIEMRAALEKERDQLAAERTQLVTERDQLTAASTGSREMIQRVGADGVEHLKGMIDELTDERSELEHKLLRAQAQIDSLRDMLQTTRSKLDRSIPVPESAPVNATQAEVMLSIAQELRTPMSSIVGYVDLLLSESVGTLGILQRQFLGRVKANADRLDTLLEDFIRITAIDTGEFHLEPIPVDMIEVVDDAITTTRTQFKEKGITLRIDVPDEVPPLIGDRDALQQVVIQLLSNAYLATRTDGEVGIAVQNVERYPVPARSAKALQRPDADDEGPDSAPAEDSATLMDGILMSVHDQGPGISGEDQARVFSRLYRADNPLILGLGDTGVGLSIARALVEMHHGRIWLESRPGTGTTFKLLIPLNAIPAKASDAASQPGAVVAPEPEAAERGEGDKNA